MMKTKITDEQLKQFLANCRVVVADASTNSGRSIRKLLTQYGAKAESVIVVEQFLQAEKEIKSAPIGLLVTDLKFEGRSGLDLIPLQEAHYKNRLEIATLVMCPDPSQIEIGMMIDARVDATLIKPFNFENLKESILQALQTKVSPASDLKLIEEGKALLKDQKFSEALKIFQRAAQIGGDHKTLAIYYEGSAYQGMKDFKQAISTFELGAQIDPKDYRCLLGRFECRMQEGSWGHAYEAAADLHKTYPISGARIPDLVRLSVLNQKFEDMNSYHEIFKKIQQPIQAMNKAVIAGLLVCAKFFYQKKNPEKAKDSIETAMKTSLETQTLRGEVLQYSVEVGMIDRAESYWAELPSEIKSMPEVRQTALEITNAKTGASQVVNDAKGLLQDGIKSPRIYELILKKSVELKRNPSVIEELLGEACAAFPDKTDEFKKLVSLVNSSVGSEMLSDLRPGWVPVEPFPLPRLNPSFVSGDENSAHIRVKYYLQGESLVGRAWFGKATQGPPGHAHGGSMAALLDEVMGGTCWALGKPVLAAQITIDFKNKLPLDSTIEFEGKIVRTEGKKLYTVGSLQSIDGTKVYAEGKGLFIRVELGAIGAEKSGRK